MIEAVSSIVQSSPALQASVKQVAVEGNANQVSATPVVEGQSPALSSSNSIPLLNIQLNTQYDKAVLEVRRSASSKDVDQIPTDARLEAQIREQARREAQSQALNESIAPPAQSSSAQTQNVNTQTSVNVAASQAADTPSPQLQQVAAFEVAAQSTATITTDTGSDAGVSVLA